MDTTSAFCQEIVQLPHGAVIASTTATMRTPHVPPATRLARAAAAGLIGGAAAVALYAFLVEPRKLQLRHVRVDLPGLHPDLDGLRIALLSDLHMGSLTPRMTIRKAVRRTLAGRPHLIALTGDLIDRHIDDLRPALRRLQDLQAPLGVFAVPGNHDRSRVDINEWRRALRGHPPIRDITNAHVLLLHGAARLCIAGVDDLEEGTPRLTLPHPADRDFTILLAHNPDQAERTRRSDDDVDLVLAGHTHGGQVRLPLFGPVLRKSNVYDQGLRRRPWARVYTSRGVGTTALPLRLNAPPEVAILELRALPPPDPPAPPPRNLDRPRP